MFRITRYAYGLKNLSPVKNFNRTFYSSSSNLVNSKISEETSDRLVTENIELNKINKELTEKINSLTHECIRYQENQKNHNRDKFQLFCNGSILTSLIYILYTEYKK